MSSDYEKEDKKGRVSGKIALVTGGAQGLGAATAQMLFNEGAKVFISDINFEKAKAKAAEIDDSVLALAHDVSSEESWIEVIKQIEEHAGGLNILVNNAGVGTIGSVEDMSLESWQRVHDINLNSVFLGCKHALPLMKTSGFGSIVNISSIAGIIASENYAAYNSSKAAVRHLSKSIALHCAKLGGEIRSNSVHPVFINTPILEPFKEFLGEKEAVRKLASQIPVKRLGEPEDVAYAVLFLASDESKMITGSELLVDGGISAR